MFCFYFFLIEAGKKILFSAKLSFLLGFIFTTGNADPAWATNSRLT